MEELLPLVPVHLVPIVRSHGSIHKESGWGLWWWWWSGWGGGEGGGGGPGYQKLLIVSIFQNH